MLARFIPHGFGIILSMLNLMKKSTTKIHAIDIEKLLRVDNLDKFINNKTFLIF